MNYRKIFLIAFICSLATAAMIGVYGILTTRFGSPKLIATMLTIALFSLTALGTAIVLDKHQWRIAMFISLAISAFGLLSFFTMIFFDRSFSGKNQDLLGQIMGISATLAISIPLAGLLGLTRFEQSFFQTIRVLAILLVFVSAGIICGGIIVEFDSPGFPLVKIIGVSLIFTALGVICLPVLHKLVGMPPPSETVASDLELTLVCPRCSLSQSLKTGASRCANCRLRFVIEVEEPRCPKCRYLLYQLTEPRCPECGTPIDDADILTPANAPAV
jgi:hypothetical protein